MYNILKDVITYLVLVVVLLLTAEIMPTHLITIEEYRWSSLLYALFVVIWSKFAENKFGSSLAAKITTISIYLLFTLTIGWTTSLLIIFPKDISIMVVPVGLVFYLISLAVFIE